MGNDGDAGCAVGTHQLCGCLDRFENDRLGRLGRNDLEHGRPVHSPVRLLEELTGRTGALVACLLAFAGGAPLSVSARVDHERAVERTRYQFVIGNTKPFDEVYPRSVFEKRVQNELAEERVLRKAFGISVTPKLLEGEFQRIERRPRRPNSGRRSSRLSGTTNG